MKTSIQTERDNILRIFNSTIAKLQHVKSDHDLIIIMHDIVVAVGNSLAKKAVDKADSKELQQITILEAYFEALTQRKTDDVTLITYNLEEHLEIRGRMLLKLYDYHQKQIEKIKAG